LDAERERLSGKLPNLVPPRSVRECLGSRFSIRSVGKVRKDVPEWMIAAIEGNSLPEFYVEEQEKGGER
jgi:hypothetical protein